MMQPKGKHERPQNTSSVKQLSKIASMVHKLYCPSEGPWYICCTIHCRGVNVIIMIFIIISAITVTVIIIIIIITIIKFPDQRKILLSAVFYSHSVSLHFHEIWQKYDPIFPCHLAHISITLTYFFKVTNSFIFNYKVFEPKMSFWIKVSDDIIIWVHPEGTFDLDAP